MTGFDNYLERFGRRLRIGMIGGGIGSFIGETHRIALRSDGLWDLVAGVFSRSRDANEAMGRHLLIAPERVYSNFIDLIRGERERSDPVDAVVVATPPSDHLEIVSALLENGFHVICEKPLCVSSQQVEVVANAARTHQQHCVLTNCYSAYPAVRQAREMIASGALGSVFLLNVEFASGAYSNLDNTNSEIPWRLSSKDLGGLGPLADLGAHVFQMAEFVANQSVQEVAASITYDPNLPNVIENGFIDARFENGAIGRFWVTYKATGNVHGLSFEIYGREATLKWNHEQAEWLWLLTKNGPAQLITKAGPGATPSGVASSRFSAGHPDGYGLAFATIYRDFARALMAESFGEDAKALWRDLPNLADGRRVMRIIEAALKSSNENHQWAQV